MLRVAFTVVFLARACAEAARLGSCLLTFQTRQQRWHTCEAAPLKAAAPVDSLCLPSPCDGQVSGGWAGDQTSRASPASSTRAARAKGDQETRGRTGDPRASAASRSLLRTNLKEAPSSL